MASSTVLNMVKEFTARTGIKRPSVVVSSADPQVIQILALLNEEIEEVTRRYVFQSMLKEKVHTTTAAEDQGALNTIVGAPVRYILNEIFWNRTTKLPISGPIPPKVWQQYKAISLTGSTLQYRIKEDRLFLMPAPPAGQSLAFEYVPEYVIIDADNATLKQYFSKDGDTCLLPDVILLAGLRWRWKREKGLNYLRDESRYHDMCDTYKLRDGTASAVDMGASEQRTRPGILVPYGSWPVSGG